MFRIRFQGLITHAEVSGQVAVFYSHPRHRAIVTVANADLITGTGQTTAPVAGTGTGVTCFRLNGRMRLQGLEGGPVLKYLNGVPKLPDICDGTKVQPVIVARSPHPDFRAYLDLSGGALAIEDWFEETATFDNVVFRCVPRIVTYSAGAIEASVRLFIDNADTFVTLQPNAEVTMSNVDFLDDKDSREYETYKRFFTDATTIQTPRENTSAMCPFGSAEAQRNQCTVAGTLSVQCSNNQFP